MVEKDDIKKEVVVDEEEAKKQFLEELKNKNKEEKKQLEEVEEVEEDKKEESEVAVIEEKKIAVNENKESHKSFISNTLKANIIDTAISAVAALAGVYIFDFILRIIFGYYIVDYKGAYIILFLLVLILYPLIMEHTKYKRTLGQKLSKIEVIERNE